MFDLNLEAIDIEAFECVAVERNQRHVTECGLLIVESNQKNEGVVAPSGTTAENAQIAFREVQTQHNLSIMQQPTSIFKESVVDS